MMVPWQIIWYVKGVFHYFLTPTMPLFSIPRFEHAFTQDRDVQSILEYVLTEKAGQDCHVPHGKGALLQQPFSSLGCNDRPEWSTPARPLKQGPPSSANKSRSAPSTGSRTQERHY